MEVSFPTDSDGFLSQECPSCEQRFKVLCGQGSEEAISFCPYCGYNSQESWLTQEQIDHLRAVAMNVVVAPKLREFRQRLKATSSEFLKVDLTSKSNLSRPSSPPIEIDGTFDILHFPCCKETIKVIGQQRHFCIICGMEVDKTMNDSKRVFLSHKSVDKDLVIDFKETLELLGYEPWLDDEAMPAGTVLERGLKKGMKDSCAVIFFITPKFKDEGFLETEINYAAQEKRNKGDKFAIITLQFVDKDGEEASIPDLLQSYVYKTPKSDLEALREIVRALPVGHGPIDWHERITGVTTGPQQTSTAAELSDEAKAILREAVSSPPPDESIYFSADTVAQSDSVISRSPTPDESIYVVEGERIQVGRTSMTPVYADARTIAYWKEGLKELQQRGYIRDRRISGTSGVFFEVTKKGYEAADELGLSNPDPSYRADI